MKRTIKVDLSIKGINKLIDKIDILQEGIEKANKNIVDKMSDYALEEIQNNYAATPYKDGNEDVAFFKKGTETNKTIGASGTQVLYNEFGTGTEGQRNSHPIKDEFNLKDYNSGKTIRPNNNPNSSASQLGIPLGELYWTYKDGDIKKYTQGIPAGMQVYNAAESLKRKQKEIIEKEVGDVLSKL